MRGPRVHARHRPTAGALIAAPAAPDTVAFADLGLPDALVEALARGGIETAFPIQSATIADALAGRDVLGKARTGSGKTLGFGLPAIARLADAGRAEPNKPRAIVLVPTRELAMQVNDALEPYAHAMHVSLRLVAGGLSMSKQIFALERGVHLLVATPGRLADLVRRGHADLSAVDLVVLDEADHMAEMGFMDEITEILAGVPAGGQRLLFSATLDGDVDRLIAQYMNDPVTHDVTDGDDTPPKLEHIVLNVPPNAKYQLATRIAAREGRTIVFVRTKLAADRIAEQMREAGVLAVALHGDKSQAERNNAITGFRAGSIPVLVATDVAARGIHVDHVDLVMQIDPPADHKDYTHRSGRTARAGEAGIVVTLVLPHQRRQTDRMFERAGVEPTFRKIHGEDEQSLALIDRLTGGREPSGVPVMEPRLPRAGRGRPERGGRPGRERPHRPRRDDRWSPRYEDRGFAANDDVARRERELAERERALQLREQELATRERERDLERRERELQSRERATESRTEARRDDRPRHDDRKGGYGKSDDRKGGYGKSDDRKGGYGKSDDRKGGYGKSDDRKGGYGKSQGQSQGKGGKQPWGGKSQGSGPNGPTRKPRKKP